MLFVPDISTLETAMASNNSIGNAYSDSEMLGKRYANAQPCILIHVMVSYPDKRQKQLVPTLKDQPCCVDKAFCLASDANLDTER
jgi:hypothetical protein